MDCKSGFILVSSQISMFFIKFKNNLNVSTIGLVQKAYVAALYESIQNEIATIESICSDDLLDMIYSTAHSLFSTLTNGEELAINVTEIAVNSLVGIVVPSNTNQSQIADSLTKSTIISGKCEDSTLTPFQLKWTNLDCTFNYDAFLRYLSALGPSGIQLAIDALSEKQRQIFENSENFISFLRNAPGNERIPSLYILNYLPQTIRDGVIESFEDTGLTYFQAVWADSDGSLSYAGFMQFLSSLDSSSATEAINSLTSEQQSELFRADRFVDYFIGLSPENRLWAIRSLQYLPTSTQEYALAMLNAEFSTGDFSFFQVAWVDNSDVGLENDAGLNYGSLFNFLSVLGPSEIGQIIEQLTISQKNALFNSDNFIRYVIGLAPENQFGAFATLSYLVSFAEDDIYGNVISFFGDDKNLEALMQLNEDLRRSLGLPTDSDIFIEFLEQIPYSYNRKEVAKDYVNANYSPEVELEALSALRSAIENLPDSVIEVALSSTKRKFLLLSKPVEALHKAFEELNKMIEEYEQAEWCILFKQYREILQYSLKYLYPDSSDIDLGDWLTLYSTAGDADSLANAIFGITLPEGVSLNQLFEIGLRNSDQEDLRLFANYGSEDPKRLLEKLRKPPLTLESQPISTGTLLGGGAGAIIGITIVGGIAIILSDGLATPLVVSLAGGAFVGASVNYGSQVGQNIQQGGFQWNDFTQVDSRSIALSAGEGALFGGAGYGASMVARRLGLSSIGAARFRFLADAATQSLYENIAYDVNLRNAFLTNLFWGSLFEPTALFSGLGAVDDNRIIFSDDVEQYIDELYLGTTDQDLEIKKRYRDLIKTLRRGGANEGILGERLTIYELTQEHIDALLYNHSGHINITIRSNISSGNFESTLEQLGLGRYRFLAEGRMGRVPELIKAYDMEMDALYHPGIPNDIRKKLLAEFFATISDYY